MWWRYTWIKKYMLTTNISVPLTISFCHIIIPNSLICQMFGILSLRSYFHGTRTCARLIPITILLAGPPLCRASPGALLVQHLLICMPVILCPMFSWQFKILYEKKPIWFYLIFLWHNKTTQNCVCILRIALYMYVSIHHTTGSQCLIQWNFDHTHFIRTPRCVTAVVIKSAL